MTIPMLLTLSGLTQIIGSKGQPGQARRRRREEENIATKRIEGIGAIPIVVERIVLSSDPVSDLYF